MSNSVRPHRWQPTRLPCPWDSPGKNTGVGCHFLLQCMKVKSESEGAQSCPTLSDPMDYSLSDSSIRGIFQARVLEWGAIAFSKIRNRNYLLWYGISVSYLFWVHCMRAKLLQCVWLFATLWAVACQAPLSMGFPRQEYWSRLPCPPSGSLPDPGIKPVSLYVFCIVRLTLYH